ncbi:MAG TPA: hypothetical protein VIV60_16050 [Polyangiaceae bacterium]
MPSEAKSIDEMARDYVDGVRLSEALRANLRIEPVEDPKRQEWQRRWLDLSDWARERELRQLEAEMTRHIEELRQSSDRAQVQSSEATALSVYGDGNIRNLIYELDPTGESPIAVEWTNQLSARDAALRMLKMAHRESMQLVEAQCAVKSALTKGSVTRYHFAEIRRLRKRYNSLAFLLMVVLIAIIVMRLR